MRRRIGFLAVMLLLTAALAGCGAGKFEDLALDVPKMTVSSASVNSEGKLYTVTAANKNPNDPKGGNKSPDLKWEKVESAACYAAVMFDTSANWLHMFLPEINDVQLTEGLFTDPSVYTGAYPPENSGEHAYRIEVFALKEKPHNLVFAVDQKQSYRDIVKALNRYNGRDGNVLTRGYVVGSYANGDNTLRA